MDHIFWTSGGLSVDEILSRGRECGKRYRDKINMHSKDVKYDMSLIKRCENCNSRFYRPVNLSLSNWKKRSVCSPDCQVELTKKKRENDSKRIYEPKTCLVCGNKFEKRRNMGRTKWENQKFCSQNCQIISMTKKYKDRHESN